jgi:hypothetical protein
MLQSHPTAATVLDAGFSAMRQLEKHFKPLRKALVDGGVIPLAVSALEAHGRTEDVASAACALLMGFASDRDSKAKAEYTEQMVSAGALRAIVSALQPSAGEFKPKRDAPAPLTERKKAAILALHVRAIWALVTGSKTPSAKLATVELGGIEALVAAIEVFPESESLSYNACCVLWILLNDPDRPEDKQRFREVDGIRVVVESMKKHRSSRQQQEAGCGAIMALAKGDDVGHPAIKEAGGIDALGAAMAAHPDCGKVHHNVALALEHMRSITGAGDEQESRATARRATMALEEARRCWPRSV